VLQKFSLCHNRRCSSYVNQKLGFTGILNTIPLYLFYILELCMPSSLKQTMKIVINAVKIVGSGDLRQMSIPSPAPRAISFLHPKELEACIPAP
jgi:hypothetical protein